MYIIKRWAAVLLAAAAMNLTACGGAAQTGNAAAQESAEETGYGFSFNGTRYQPGMDAEEALKLLGEPTGSRDVNNCARGAVRKAYSYGDGDFEVFADLNADETKDVVKTITLMSERVSTEEGLKVGDPVSRIQEVYPEAKDEAGEYVADLDGIRIIISQNKLRGIISYITYEETPEQ